MVVKPIKCWRKPPEPLDSFYRPLLMSIEMPHTRKTGACGQQKTPFFRVPCPQCGGGCRLPRGQPAGMAYSNNLCCPGNTTGSCGVGGCSCGPRLPGQGPCDPPCFSKFVFPEYAPFIPEPKFQLPPLPPLDGCGLSPCGGTSMYGRCNQSCWRCNHLGSCGGCCSCSDSCLDDGIYG